MVGQRSLKSPVVVRLHPFELGISRGSKKAVLRAQGTVDGLWTGTRSWEA